MIENSINEVLERRDSTAEEEKDDDIGRKTLTWKKDREEGEGETKG